MVKKEIFFSLIGGVVIAGVFFYKLVLFGQLPFPGDLLIAEYKPWRSYSFLGYNPGSYPNKAQYPDVLRQLYPWKTEAIEQLKAGHLPLWNPHNFSGSPLLANFQSAALYPLGILYFLLSQPLAWSILVFLQPVLASFFTYWYSRSIKLSPLAASIAAISFAYGSFMTVWLEYNTIGHVILWLPLALWAIEKRRMTILLLSLSLPYFAGHPQIATSVYVFSLAYFWIRTRRLTMTFVIPIGIAAVQIIPGIELMLNSARSPLSYDFFVNKVLIQPWQLIMLALPDFFGNPATRTYWPTDTYIGKVLSIGLIPLFFFLATVRSSHPFRRIFIVSALVILLFATKNPLTIFLYQIPEFRTSNPTLFIYLFQFSLAVLAGIGLDQFSREPHTLRKITLRSIQVLTILVIGFVIVGYLKYTVGFKALVYATVIASITLALFFVAVVKKRTMSLILTALILVQLADLFRVFQKFNPFVPKELVFPTTQISDYLKNTADLDRIWGYGTAAIEANFATQLGLYSPDGYDPLYPAWYGEFITLSENGRLSRAVRSDAGIVPGYGRLDLSDNSYRLAILSRLGVRYILDRIENNTLPPDTFTKKYETDGWIIYENNDAIPKAIFASGYIVAQTKEEFISKYFDPSFDTKTQVVLENDPSLAPLAGESTSHIDSNTPNRIDLTVLTNAPKILVLSDTYYPGWVAKIDGKETEILRANYTMRAISVPAGNHSVTFSYEPQAVHLGIAISIISLVALSVLLWKHARK